MKIRVGQKKDAHDISKMLLMLTEKFIAVGFSEAGSKSMRDSMKPEAILSYMELGYRYHVAEIAGKIMGAVATRENTHLYHLFIEESHQGKGYARALWEVAKAACIAAGNDKYFTVNSSLNAQDVYKSWGFTPISGIRETNGVKDMPMKLELSA
ncbi:MAG: GNAT superfamily N-acetyltransferase [Candidatus Azotimanducaceae bacterium]|jgi:GNAT superfamily N-acetyltransferase